jgi:DNA helicase-2/ATP-dependent DNA helicase PcrA
MTYTLPTTWSKQQAAFIDWAHNGRGSCVLIAVAGSGKTTTFLGAVAGMRGKTAIMAYNRKIGDELSRKLVDLGIDWKQANAGTVHSFGLKAIRKFSPNVKIDDKNVKVRDIFAKLAGEGHPFTSVVVKLVSLAKQRAVGAVCGLHDYAAWLDIINHFDLIDEELDAEGDAVDEIISLAQRTLKASNAMTDFIDFDDMVYLPLVLPMRHFRYDNIIVDEAQDTNPARRELVKRLLLPGGRLMAVGDPRQAIYGFTGADNDSLELIRQDFKAIEMPLTVTYRCPRAIVEFAHQWVSHIEAHEDAIEGTVSQMAWDALLTAKPTSTDAILCRNTKPLVQAAFALIRARIPCKIEGRDIAKSILRLAQKWKSAKTIDAYEKRLDKFFADQSKKVEGTKLQMLEDMVATMHVIIDQVRSTGGTHMTQVCDAVDQLFADDVSGVVTLSTIHKAKGREWTNVYWLNRSSTCPSRYAKQAWEVAQEVNLCYVAATRAMENLIDLTMVVAG